MHFRISKPIFCSIEGNDPVRVGQPEVGLPCRTPASRLHMTSSTPITGLPACVTMSRPLGVAPEGAGQAPEHHFSCERRRWCSRDRCTWAPFCCGCFTRTPLRTCPCAKRWGAAFWQNSTGVRLDCWNSLRSQTKNEFLFACIISELMPLLVFVWSYTCLYLFPGVR